MPKKTEEKSCQYKDWLGYEICPHDYFGTYTNRKTGKETDYCILHAPMELKEDKINAFWGAFRKLFAEVQTKYEEAETEEAKGDIWLDCTGFVFPNTDDKLWRTYKKFPFNVSFFEATFEGEANFRRTIFAGKASFKSTTFAGGAYFEEAEFAAGAYFMRARFPGVARFWNVKFPKRVTFKGAFVSDELTFPETQFAEDADFRDIEMFIEEEDGTRKGPGVLLFDNAFFHRPERVQIGGYNTDLGQWSFKDTNIENVNFVNEEWKPKRRYWVNLFRRLTLIFIRKFKKDWEPQWRGRDEYKVVEITKSLKWLFKRRGRKVIYDEILASERKVTWEDAGQVYRRLRKKFERELAYELTSDFHYGQMECRRLNSDRHPLHPDRIFAFLYKIVSGYGERVGLPLLWFAVFFGLFTWLFLVTGFPAPDGSQILWVPGFEGMLSGDWWASVWQGISFTLRSSVSFAVPQYGEGVGETVGPTLPALMFFWKLLAVVFGTFFILALRRRFKK